MFLDPAFPATVFFKLIVVLLVLLQVDKSCHAWLIFSLSRLLVKMEGENWDKQ